MGLPGPTGRYAVIGRETIHRLAVVYNTISTSMGSCFLRPAQVQAKLPDLSSEGLCDISLQQDAPIRRRQV